MITCRVSAGVRSLYIARVGNCWFKKTIFFLFLFFFFIFHDICIFYLFFYAVFVLSSLLLRARAMFYLLNQVCLLSPTRTVCSLSNV